MSRHRRRRSPAKFFRRLTAGVCNLLIVTVCASDQYASAYTWFIYGDIPVVWASATDTRWLSEISFPEGSEFDFAVLTGIGAWNITGISNWSYTAGRGEIFPPDQIDGNSFTAAVPADYFDNPNILGVTFLANDGDVWFDMDTLFNADAANNWLWSTDLEPTCDVITDPETHGYVLASVAMHEFGHAFGLGHEDLISCTMNSYYPNGGTSGQLNILEPRADDRAGQRFLYPGGNVTDLALGNFRLDVEGYSSPLTFSPTEAGPGDAITAIIQVENLGSTTVNAVRQGFYLSTDDVVEVSDRFLGSLTWETMEGLASGEFEVVIQLPGDLETGEYYLGTILDDTETVTEAFEDNNHLVYCSRLTVPLLAPVIAELDDQTASCGSVFHGPVPMLTQPDSMTPVAWTLQSGPPGLTIDAVTGAASWPQPLGNGSPHEVTFRAINPAGYDDQSFFIFVDPVLPAVVAIGGEQTLCGSPFTGPTPEVANETCAGHVYPWTLESGPSGMTIDFATGVVSWPLPSTIGSPHRIRIRGFNGIGSAVVEFPLNVVGGDLNSDAHLDLSDWPRWVDCINLPNAVVSPECACADMDGDHDADLLDFGRFQTALNDE